MTRDGRVKHSVRGVLRRALVLSAFAFATQTAGAQQTLQQRPQSGVAVQHPKAVPNVTHQPATPEMRPPAQPAPNVVPPAVEENVDTTDIWNRLHRHDVKGAKVEFAKLTRAHPRWNPPADLVLALRAAQSVAAKVPRTVPTHHVLPPTRHVPPAPSATSSSPGDAALARAVSDADRGAPIDEITADAQNAAALGRSDVWETIGWKLFNHHRAADALTAFKRAKQTESAIFGRVLAARAAGHEDEAADLACEQRSLSQRLAQACADSIASRQLAVYNAGNYAEAEKLGDQLAEIAPDRTGARVLTAWSAYHLGDPKKAADIFAALYDKNHDHDLANGLALSLRASGQTDVLLARVAAGDTMLAEIVAAENADTAWYRKQFDLADTGPSPKPSLAGRDDWRIGSGFETALISGQPGESRLHAYAGRLFAEEMVGDVRIGFSVMGAGVVLGEPFANALIGLRPLPDQMPPTSGAGLIQPNLTALWQTPDWTISTALGVTPLNAAVAPRPTASASATHYMDPIILSGRLFARSVTDSLLSYGGMRDPVSGTNWGRVMDLGGSLQAIYLPADRISLSLTSEGGYLVGDNVANNSRYSFRFDGAYDFRPEGYDHLRVGPFASFVHYVRNLDFYTLGQGGYYSPNGDMRAGILIDFLTAEGKWWQIQAKQSVSRSNVSESASPVYPLGVSPFSYKSSRFTGIDIDTQLSASVLVTDRLILSGFAGYSNAPSYNGYIAGIFLSLSFDNRHGVFSADLPDGTFRPFTVWK